MSGGFTLPALFAYSYRPDGLIESQQINDPGNSLVGTTTLSYARSMAGRLQSRTEAGPGSNHNAITNNYDVYGRATGMNYPAGSYTNAEYDASGQELGVGTSVGTIIPTTMTYTQRGELTRVSTAVPNPPITAYANGMGVTLPQPGWEGSTTWDPQMGVVLGGESDNGNGPDNGDTSAQSGFTFDAAGRNTAVSVNNSFPEGLGDGFDTEEYSGSTKTYDDESHLIAATVGPFPGNGGNGNQPYNQMLAYSWGPNGHPIQIGSTPVGVAGTTSNMAFETLHWDGDQLLFTTNSFGQVDDIKIGSLGDITPLDPAYKGVTFYDRDFSGAVGFCHNAAGAAGPGSTNPYMRYSKFGSMPASPCVSSRSQRITAPSSIAWWSGESMTVPGGRWMIDGNSQVGHGTLIGMPRTDGITDGFNVIQGVRSYDPTLGSWTTPDAYAGNLCEPGSQKSYVWNGNNAVSSQDPTGFSGDFNLLYDANPQDGGAVSGAPSLEAVEDDTISVVDKSGRISSITITVNSNYKMGDFGSRASDIVALAWSLENYDEANTPGTPSGYEIGAREQSEGKNAGFILEQTEGGGNGNDTNFKPGEFQVGDAVIHSHGEYNGAGDFSQHIFMLKLGLSAVYTLTGGFLYVQWNGADGSEHYTQEKIYNVACAMRANSCKP